MAAKKAKSPKKEKTNHEAENKAVVLARQDDGTIQLTLTVPIELVMNVREQVIKKFVEDVELPGFRKGKAPADMAIKHVDKQKVYEQTLQVILPEVYSVAVEEHKLKPILAPRFELISVEEDKDWVVRAVTCEVPEINLGDYKKLISDKAKVDSIWVPGKDDQKDKKEGPSREEKEQQIIKVLIENVEIKIPKVLIEEEVNHKLSQLLEQVQRLGLTVEQYMASTGRNVDQLKEEYAKQAEESIKLVLLLNKVGEEQKITVTDSEIEEVIKASLNATGDTPEARDSIDNPEQKRLVYSILLRRKTLDTLVSLI